MADYRGTDGDDTLYGAGGYYWLRGGEGNDKIYGSKRVDWFDGGAGDDRLEGGAGKDALLGGEGDDYLDGGPGEDTLYGGAGDDTLYGGEEQDNLHGGAGDDTLYGGAWHDGLYGGAGDDTLYGGEKNDNLKGGAGDDELYGGPGHDTLTGGPGADSLTGGAGNNTLYYEYSDAGVNISLRTGHASGGHAEGDTFSGIRNIRGSDFNDRLEGDDNDNGLWGGGGHDTLFGFGGDDTLGGRGELYGGKGDDWLHGGEGDDYLDGGPGEDQLYGGAGDDTLYGGEEHDRLNGGAGDDTLYGGEEYDRLNGGAGDDELYGGAGHDSLKGGAGADTLTGGAGRDWLTGGAGTDIFRFNRGDSLGSGDVIKDFRVAGANGEFIRDALDLRAFNIDYTRDLESQGLTFSGLISAGRSSRGRPDDVADDGIITLPDGGIITLLDIRGADAALTIYDFTFVGEGGALINVDAGDDSEDQPDPDPEGQPGPEPEGNGGALTNVDADDGAGVPNWRSHLQEVVTSGGLTGRLDAGDLSIGGGVDLPAADDGLHRSNYHLYYRADGGSYFLRFDDAITADLPISATAAQVAAALEGLDGVTSAEVTGEPGNFTIALTADEPHVLQWGDLNLDGDGQLDYLAEPPADDGDGGALTNVDAGDEPEDQPDPEPGGQPGPDPEGDGGALTNVEAGDEPGGLTPPEPEARVVEGAAPQKSILQQHLNLLKLITSGASGSLDAGDLSIWGGADLPASDDGLHRSSYHLYYRADGGSYFLRFDDAVTADLPVGATAAQVDAALEGLDGVTSAEVTGEPGNFTIALTADEPHVLQWGDLRLDGDGSLDYLIA